MKNLITYLKTLWRRVADSQSTDVSLDRRLTVGSPSFHRRSTMLKLVSVLVLILTVGVGNVWGAIDANSTWTATAFGSLSDDATVIILNNFGNAIPNADATSSGPLKVAASYNRTTHKISVTTAGKSLDNIVWTVKKTKNGTKFYVYGSSTKTLGLSGTSSNTAVRVNTSLSYTEFVMGASGYLLKYYNASRYVGEYTGGSDWRSYNTENASNYKSSGTQQTLTFYVLDEATPTVTPDPTSLSWGTVLQGSSQSTKTITITGANLTAGTLTISATGGYSVTPTSKSVSGTLAATTLTVTPPSTSTTGAKNGKVTISGGGLASNVEVDLSMTVNAASTVTWMNNGSEYSTTLVANGSKPEFPDNPSSCDGTSTTFVGWTPTPWSGKLDDVSSKTIYTSGSAMPNVSGPVTYHAVFAKSSGSETEHTLTLNKEKFYDAGATSSGYGNTDLTIDGIVMKRSQWGWQQNGVNVYLQGKSSNAMYNDTQLGYIKSIAITKYGGSGNIYVGTSKQPTTNETAISTTTLNYTKSNNYTYFRINSTSTLQLTSVVITYVSGSVTYSKYLTTCCADPGLNYATGSVTKTYGEGVFTNTLTNSHSVAVTYALSSVSPAGCVSINSSTGQVTINAAGSATVTASFAGNATYCADEASYTLTVNKADISPTLTYTPNSVAAGENTSAPTVGGNLGSGGVTYAITSATPSGCATIDAGTGIVTGEAVGSVTVTATVAATTNYNEGSATANVTITAASYFTNGATVFIQAESSSAWNDNSCVKAWFNNNGAGGAAQETFWLFDATGGDAGKKLFATVVPASGSLNQVTLQRFDPNSDCDDFWNANGTLTKASDGGSNTLRSYGASDNNVAWNGSGVTIDLHGDPSGDAWASSLASFSDQGAGVWTATYENYAPANAGGESQDFKAKTNYNGWIGNTGSNNNATLDGMHVGSTYNITATLDVKDHSLEMSKTFVKGTVHFDLQGHGLAISDLTNVTAGSKISAPSPAPSATGYDFGGWYNEPACTNVWNFGSDVVNETMTLYAKWTAHEYTITKTLTNVTSSPVIPSTYTYTGAAAGLNYTISPSDGYRLPTEITVSGTTYTWNPATGALALTGTISSNVTITIVAVQTHTVDWYVGGSAPANKIGDDGQTTVVDHGGKISDFPATTPDGSACDKVFVGWTNTSSYVHGTSPLFNDVAGSPTINADAQFYAVFATESSGGDPYYQKVTSTGDISNDGRYLIVYETDGVVFNGGLGTIDAGNNVISATFSEGAIEITDGNRSDLANAEFSIDMTNLYIKNKDNKYIYQDSYGNGLPNTTDPHDLHSISIDGNGDFIVEGKGQNSNSPFDYAVLRFNSATGAGNYRFRFYKNSQQKIQLYKYIGGITYSDYTLTCVACANTVTVSYNAAPTGGTVAVEKGGIAIANNGTVKTCDGSVNLTVTITPASHYTVTGLTAQISSTDMSQSHVGNVYTVTIPQNQTGTLTLTPTFTPETPLTITLNTNGKGTFTPIGDVYSGESFTFPVVTPSDAECASFLGWIEGTTFDGNGETTDPSDVTSLPEYHAASTSSGTLTTNKTYTAVFGEKDTQETTAYVKVAAAPADWSGDYLIVRESIERAFDGSLETLDAANNYIDITIVDGKIAKGSLAANQFTIAKVGATDNYTIKSASGKYIGRTSTSNGLEASTSTEYTNTLAYSSDHVVITSSGGPTLQMNGGTRFRYYASSQQELQLYKLGTAQMITYTYTTNPACTPRYRVTVNSAVGGSPSADKTYEHADETITITANPAAGYSFTSWTITKTTGGDNVTSTLLTGDNPTTANTTFTMPAYDITIAATYAKKMVSTLEVKDGATVISTTTGPVSGTVNISTGANKTLDVVITPSDAYDHSWTASVTDGGTYASITNVTDDGFRVNGLAQGDATITVNAPNDGSAKSVTLTVHVTDIMPEEIILKREGSDTPIETLVMYYDASESKGQYVKVNVGYSPANPTNKAFTFSSALTGKVGSHSHAPASGYEVLVANGVTSDAVNCTFTSSADGSVTKVLAVTVLPILTDRFVDYIHGNATQTVSARLSVDRYTMITDINTPSLSDASDADPTSEDCETAHYHLIGWLPQATAEALMAAGTPITEATEGLVRAGVQVEATGQTWCAIWAKEAE